MENSLAESPNVHVVILQSGAHLTAISLGCIRRVDPWSKNTTRDGIKITSRRKQLMQTAFHHATKEKKTVAYLISKAEIIKTGPTLF